jgi:type II secretory pathway component PulL
MVDLILRTSAVLGSSADVHALRFREKQMTLTVDVIIRDFDELDAIKTRAQQNAMIVNVSDATKENNRVRARLVGQYL